MRPPGRGETDRRSPFRDETRIRPVRKRPASSSPRSRAKRGLFRNPRLEHVIPDRGSPQGKYSSYAAGRRRHPLVDTGYRPVSLRRDRFRATVTNVAVPLLWRQRPRRSDPPRPRRGHLMSAHVTRSRRTIAGGRQGPHDCDRRMRSRRRGWPTPRTVPSAFATPGQLGPEYLRDPVLLQRIP